MQEMTTVKQYCTYLGWGPTHLSREARISYNSAKNAIDGEKVSNKIKLEICSAFSRSLNRPVNVGDLQWEE